MTTKEDKLSKIMPLISIREEEELGDTDNPSKYPLPPPDRATLENLDEADIAELSEREKDNKAPIQRFGSQMGLFSKFTNAPTLDEFALGAILAQMEEKPKEEEERDYSHMLSVWSFKGPEFESPFVTDLLKRRTEYSGWYKASIMAVIFSTQFEISYNFIAGALEIAYISPLFTTMKLPPLIDATVWIFPVIFITILTPFVNIFATHLQYERITHLIIMILSVIGCFIFAFLDQFLPLLTDDPASMRLWFIYLGFLAFCLVDVANEMTLLIQNKMVQADISLDTAFNNKLSGVASFARILAYFLASIEAFGMDFSKKAGIFPRNLDISFLVAGIFLFTSLILAALFQTAPVKGYKGSLLALFKTLRTAHFLPPPRRIINGKPKLKLIVLSHFFGAGGVLMFSVYATLWAGTNVFQGDGRAEEHTEAYKTFEIGMSWGSFCLLISAIFSALTKYLTYKLTHHPEKRHIKTLYLSSLLIAAAAIILCQYLTPMTTWFVMISLTGFAFETFHVVPGMLGDFAEVQETGKHLGHYRHLLSFSLFYAQVLMFLVVPLCFLLFPQRNDNLWGMLAAGSSLLAGAIVGAFI